MRKDTLKIAIDLDGVVYNFIDEFRDYLINHEGYDPDDLPEEYTSWDYYKVWGLSDLEYWEKFFTAAHKSHILTNGKVIPGAKEGLEKIKELGCEIVILTAREAVGTKTSETIRTNTLNWLDANGIVFDELVISNEKFNEDFDVLFDDGPHNIEAVILDGRPAIFFDQPWNRSVPIYNRVYGWDQLVESVEEMLAAFNNWKLRNAQTIDSL